MAFQKIAYCTDFSENAETAFSSALEIAEKHNSNLLILHVLPTSINPMTMGEWDVPDHPKEAIVLHLQERMQQEYGDRVKGDLPYELIVLDGHISTEILNFLKDNDIDLC
ncbi:MAG: universal stress protein, partial [Desulfobacteraceae bacterium]